ncbi:Adhesion G-protein coupled receptor G7 [Channa argus]|uniref:Adhesion G-protein coupled receptor G7 n=1 Tax=Channa argus TaxID=215402 RepID=A0A6G1PE23_CHAAH|nr:Adhesion G-protein coupled receptor G7 [Channa argus]
MFFTAAPLASSTTGSQSTTTSSSSNITNPVTTTTAVTAPALSTTTFTTAHVSFTTTLSALSTAPEGTAVTLEDTHPTTVQEGTTIAPESTNTNTLPNDTSVTPEMTNTTPIPDGTTVTPESTNATAVPEGTTVTPESTNTTMIPDGTSVTPGSTITTMIPDVTTVTPESTNATKIPDATTVIPESTNTTMTPDGTSVIPESTNTTKIPDATSVTPESTITTMIPDGTTVTTESTNATKIPDATTVIPESTNTTMIPDGTSVIPESTNTTMIPDGTSVTPESTNTTKIPDATSVTPESTITTMIPDGTTVTPESTNATAVPDVTPVTPETNFCKADKLDGFQFPSTPVGWFAYSTEICPKGTSNAGKPQASTRCSTKNGSPSFDCPLQNLQCDQTLSDIQQNLTSAADLETLASSTQILTSRPEELTAENVTAAAQIVNTLLLSPNATESVRVAAVATVSQLLNASVPDNTEENDATVGLTLTLDQLSVNLSSSLNASQSQVVQPNLVVQSAQIPAVDTQGVQFTSLTGTSGSFVANRIQLNTNASKAVVENGFIADALIYIRFPAVFLCSVSEKAAGSRQQPSNISLGFVLYQNDRFFRSSLYRSRRTSVRVLSASVRGQERSVVPQHVEMMFRPTSIREKYEYAEALGVISIVGLSISIVGLIITIIHHIKIKFWRKSHKHQDMNAKLTLLCIYVSLLAFIITFLSGVNNPRRQDDAQAEIGEANIIPGSDEHVDPDRGSCSAVAALLHFFLLATFMWNSVYGTQLLLLIQTMHRSLSSYWTLVSFAVGWGVPAVVMVITLATTYSVENPLGYRQEELWVQHPVDHCWLAALTKDKQFHFGKPMFWGFLLPIGLILIYNMVLLVLVSVTTCRTDPKLTSTRQRSLKKKFLTSFSLAVILGLSWTLGYLVLASTGHLHLVFSILFCLCTTTQGFQIFILFTARTPSFRAAVSRFFHHVSSVNIPLRTTRYSFTNCSGDTSRGTESYRDLRDQYTSKNL